MPVGYRFTARLVTAAAALVAVAACSDRPTAPSGDPALARGGAEPQRMIGINVLTNSAPTDAMLRELGTFGTVFDVMSEINAVIMLGKADQLAAIRALRYVTSAEPDGEVKLDPVDAAPMTAFTGGASMWNLDAVNVTKGPGTNTRAVAQTGKGVYVGILDSGLLPSWRAYFPVERIAAEYASAFVGGGAASQGATPTPPGWWENDQNTHGTHVTSTILGFRHPLGTFTGVAPEATVIPVKVLNQSGSGWWSAIAQGVVYITRLKTGPLKGSPMVVNMSLGGGANVPTTGILKAAIDHAIANGVIIVAAASNSGELGMGAPGSYAPVISVASVGWVRQYTSADWWYAKDFVDPTVASEFFISGSSSRQKPGQDLDLAAPGVSILGPAQTNSGQLEYQFFGGTSMATPHVAGTVALMAQKNPRLTAAEAERILEGSALFLPPAIAPDCPIISPGVGFAPIARCWGKDATGAGVLQVDRALAATGTR
jgi:subtilisin family serine protease